MTCSVTSLISDTISCISLLRLPPQCSTFSSYLLQCFQALVHSQSIGQCRGSRISNFIPFKTVEESTPELVQVVLVTIWHYVGVLLINLIVVIPNSLKMTVVSSLSQHSMMSNSVCSHCWCCQTFTQQEQELSAIKL